MSQRVAPHIISPLVLTLIYVSLLILLVLTILGAAVDLGDFNLVLALVIAFAKAALVVLFFMHVRYSSRAVRVFMFAGLFWIAILLTLTLADYATRPWIGRTQPLSAEVPHPPEIPLRVR